MDIEQMILDTLKDAAEPLKPGDIVIRTGIKKEEVDKAIAKLKKTDKIFSPKRCFYDIQK